MPKRSVALQLLLRMSQADLKELAAKRSVSVGGNKSDLANRIAKDCRRDLVDLMSRSPFHRDWWNDFAEELGAARKRSFEDLAAELESTLGGFRDQLRTSMEALGVHKVVDARRDEGLLAQYAEILQTSPRKLQNAFDAFHGSYEIATIWDELVNRFAPQADSGEPDADVPDDERPEPEPSLTIPESSRPRARAGDDDDDPPSAPVTRMLDKPRVGEVLGGRWKVVRPLGEGGMGAAYEVEGRNGMRRVAKVAHGTGSETVALEREVTNAIELAHKNVCRYYDVDEDPRFGLFVVMQHCGEALARRYAKSATPIDEAIRILAQAAEGLDYLHAAGVIHGDVTPGNLLIDGGPGVGVVRLMDFGVSSIATRVARTNGYTHMGKLHGRNPAYASNEMNAGRDPTAKSDQQMLAKVLCALLQGVDAFQRDARLSFPTLGASQAVLDAALHADTSQRHQSCIVFVRKLQGMA